MISDFVSDFVTDFNYIVFGLLILVYLGLNSQITYDKLLSRFPGAIEMGLVTNYGTLIQAVIMSLMAILLFALYDHDII